MTFEQLKSIMEIQQKMFENLKIENEKLHKENTRLRHENSVLNGGMLSRRVETCNLNCVERA